jgi:hypothetical protein
LKKLPLFSKFLTIRCNNLKILSLFILNCRRFHFNTSFCQICSEFVLPHVRLGLSHYCNPLGTSSVGFSSQTIIRSTFSHQCEATVKSPAHCCCWREVLWYLDLCVLKLIQFLTVVLMCFILSHAFSYIFSRQRQLSTLLSPLIFF